MTRARPNHDAHPRVDIDQLFVKLYLGTVGTFKEVVRFGESFVIVQTSLGRDVRNVDRAWKIHNVRQRTPRSPARTRHARYLGEVSNFITALAYVLDHLIERRQGGNGRWGVIQRNKQVT